MSPIAPRRKGWCPGALRPMETGDGLLARARPSGGRLTPSQAEAIADAAITCGTGAVVLSARANLQIRGVREEALPDLHARLGAAGLIDTDHETERLRNIVASPLSDVDPSAALDCTGSLSTLEERLAEDRALERLPAKFCFIIDAGGRLRLDDIDADIRFAAERAAGGAVFAAFLGGDDELAGLCAPDGLAETAARLARSFLALAGSGVDAPRRMRALVARVGAKAVFAEAGLEAWARRRPHAGAAMHRILGAQVFGSAIVVGLAAAFGEVEARRFKALVRQARELGATGVRLTPWRAFFLLGLEPRQAPSIIATATSLGFIADPREPLLRVAACPGAPACLHALRPVRDDAARFAIHLPERGGVVLHVSGCPKGCARPFRTAATLVATEQSYDLVLNGKADEAPTRRGLSSAQAAALLASEGDRIFA